MIIIRSRASLCQVLKVCIPNSVQVPRRYRENRWQIVYTLPFSVSYVYLSCKGIHIKVDIPDIYEA